MLTRDSADLLVDATIVSITKELKHLNEDADKATFTVKVRFNTKSWSWQKVTRGDLTGRTLSAEQLEVRP